MKLVWIQLDGYRRFATRQNLHVDCRMVALLGPNEAGKTSVLRALLALNSSSALRGSGPSQDLTRDKSIDDGHPVVVARFLLEESDYQAASNFPEIRSQRWFVAEKLASGELRLSFESEVARDPKRRNELLSDLRRSLDNLSSYQNSLQASDGAEESVVQPNWRARLDDIVSPKLPSSLEKEALNKLSGMLSDIDKINSDESENASAHLGAFIENEQKDHPEKSIQTLRRRLPQFVLFSDDDRELKSDYNLHTFFVGDKKPIPVSLKNLAATAELSLEDLFAASQSKDEGAVETQIDHSNELLKKKMQAAWNQSEITVRFRLNANVLSILVRSGESGFDSISERSDGLKQFVALFAFLSKASDQGRDVVLLIDEAEMHLHYDAQADLVQMLAKQQLARKVIYTTHSIACLPEDLGLGIRFVQPSADSSSEINNRFWSKGGSGLSPVLFGMGAATMAFLPVRFCVLTEGPTDMILLPALFRLVCNVQTLGFQISPGLAQANEVNIALMQNDGSRVQYLLDGDPGGKALERKLKDANVPESKILRLDTLLGRACVVEDFVAGDVYVEAINEELRRSGHQRNYTAIDLPETLRPSAIKNWCEQHGIPAPHKVDVAYRILDQLDEKQIVDGKKATALQELYKAITERFESEA